MAEYTTIQNAIRTTWMILEGLGFHESENGELAKTVEEVFATAPAADVEPVVRCADCRSVQSNIRQDGHLPDGVPEYDCRWWCGETDPKGYCSKGKREKGAKTDA